MVQTDKQRETVKAEAWRLHTILSSCLPFLEIPDRPCGNISSE